MIFEVNTIASMHDAIHALCRYLTEQSVSPDLVFDSKLVASELLGNVLRHTQKTARVKWEIKDGFVYLRVSSDVTFVPPVTSQKADVYAEHGRGLFLIDTVCVERTVDEDGSIVVKLKIQ